MEKSGCIGDDADPLVRDEGEGRFLFYRVRNISGKRATLRQLLARANSTGDTTVPTGIEPVRPKNQTEATGSTIVPDADPLGAASGRDFVAYKY
jgi:hypothetical protein